MSPSLLKRKCFTHFHFTPNLLKLLPSVEYFLVNLHSNVMFLSAINIFGWFLPLTTQEQEVYCIQIKITLIDFQPRVVNHFLLTMYSWPLNLTPKIFKKKKCPDFLRIMFYSIQYCRLSSLDNVSSPICMKKIA